MKYTTNKNRWVAFVAALFMLFMLCCSCATDQENNITSGIVVDKYDYRPHCTAIVNKIPIIYYYSRRYRIKIQNTIEGQTIEQWIELDKETYDTYEIGDWYPRENYAILETNKIEWN